MIYRISVTGAMWATVAVRAQDENEARAMGLEVARQYNDDFTPGQISVELLDPEGPSEVLIEDWS